VYIIYYFTCYIFQPLIANASNHTITLLLLSVLIVKATGDDPIEQEMSMRAKYKRYYH
jgi:hypothetical protein